ncbi:MAG: MBL fold metallo-hydrolase [Deltaproteobacteria bacterium]|nr:MBL fold metallo-hydrolase [Deltaproteobacteria bacterium]
MTDLVQLREKRIVTSKRFRDGKFHNTAVTRMMREPFGASMAWDFVAKSRARSPSLPLPLFAETKKALSSSSSSALRLTWLGHSTVLIEIDGVRLLTDPVWGERASPVAFGGPKRFHRPPLALADLPPVDAVVLSHDHYDHLCKHTVRALASGASPNFSGRFITALGVGAHLERYGVLPGNITELDWGEGKKVGDVDVTAVPAQHFSGRGALDRNHTLWAGMVMKGPRHSVFFSGDTGPTPEHKDIGASFGPFDVALFEIGAWHPSWGDIHLGAMGAYQAFTDINARALLPVHWGTFDLGLHPWEEPAELLYNKAVDDDAPLWTPRIGEPLSWTARTGSSGASTSPTPWWREALVKR